MRDQAFGQLSAPAQVLAFEWYEMTIFLALSVALAGHCPLRIRRRLS